MRTVLLATTILLAFSAVQAQTVYKLYAGQGYTNNIYVLDPVTMDTIKFIPGAGGYRLVHCALYNKVYSTDGDNNISVVDVLSDSLVATIDPTTQGNNASELEPIVLSPDQTKLYVADESSEALFVLNTANDSVIASTTLNSADEMENMVISPDGAFLYIVDNSDVLKVNTTTLAIEATIAVNGDAHGIEISEDGQTLYSDAQEVVVIDVPTFSITDTIASSGYYLKLNASGTRLIGVDESSFADVIELSTGVITPIVWSSGSARGIAVHPDDSEYYLATTNGVYKVDAATLTLVDFSPQISFQSVIIVDATINSVENLLSETIVLQVHPNPFQTNVNFELDLPIGVQYGFAVYDLSGRELRSVGAQNIRQNSNGFSIDLSELRSGVYICKLEMEGRVYTARVVKE